MAKRQFNFYEQHHKNDEETKILIALIPFLLAAIVWLMGYFWVCLVGDGHCDAQTGFTWFCIYLIWLFYVFNKVKAIDNTMIYAFLKQVNAQNITNEYKSRQKKIINEIVDQLIIAYNIKKPRIYLTDYAGEPNAFVYVSNSQHYLIITQSLLDKLNRLELTSILAHELAHLAANDNQIIITSEALENGLKMFAMFSRDCLLRFFNEISNNHFILGLFLLIPVFLFAVPSTCGFIVAYLLQQWVSRVREFDADAIAANVINNPQPMISALQKLNHFRQTPAVKRAIKTERQLKKDDKAKDKDKIDHSYKYLHEHYLNLFDYKQRLVLLPQSCTNLYFMNYRWEILNSHPSAKTRINRLRRLSGNFTDKK